MTEDAVLPFVLGVVLTALRRLLPPGAAVGPATDLLTLPAGSAPALDQLVAAVEEALDVELAPDLDVPSTFASPTSLAVGLIRSVGPGRRVRSS
ncbi:hypothetical protein [Streptomyces sp. cmx-4-9]|uniref:hypothetical protein n=1 Tax=Streptomyces sp. cmx-4-9 TaxID=2790941 RepID=UPI00397EC169